MEIRAFSVPKRHREPTQGSLELRYGLVKGGSSCPPIVFLHGGPGMSPIALFGAPKFGEAMAACTEGADLVLLDQRGISLTAGPVNPHGLLEAPEKAALRLVEQAEEFFARHPDADPSAINPWESALDVAALADHLGVEKVSLWAYSYGTHLAQAVLKRAPERIDRVVLCGFEGPDQTWKLPSAFDTQLKRLGLFEAAAEWVAELDEEPAFIEDFGLVAGWGARWMMGSWLGLEARIGLLKKVLAREEGALAKAVSGFVRALDRPAAFYWCDGASGASPARLQAIAADAPGTLLGHAANFPFPQAAKWWRAPDLGDAFREPLASEKTMLVVTGGMDCFTPSSNFFESRSSLPHARSLVLEGAFHDSLFLDPAVWPEIRSELLGHGGPNGATIE